MVPEAWTTVKVLLLPDEEQGDYFEMIQEWLGLSGDLPLSLDVELKSGSNSTCFNLLVEELRKHSGRWKNVTIRSFFDSPYVSGLLNDLGDTSALEVLTFHKSNCFLIKKFSFPSGRLLNVFNSNIDGIQHFGWESGLTALVIEAQSESSISFTELTRLIQLSRNLLSCHVTGTKMKKSNLTSDTKKVEAKCLNVLQTDSHSVDLLRRIFAPSLVSLRHTYHWRSEDDTDFATIASFCYDDPRQLVDLTVSIRSMKLTRLNIERPIPITSLELEASGWKEASDKILTFLALEFKRLIREGMLCDLRQEGMPCSLRHLVLNVPMTPGIWEEINDIITKFYLPQNEWPESVRVTSIESIVIIDIDQEFTAVGNKPKVSMSPTAFANLGDAKVGVVSLKFGSLTFPFHDASNTPPTPCLSL